MDARVGRVESVNALVGESILVDEIDYAARVNPELTALARRHGGTRISMADGSNNAAVEDGENGERGRGGSTRNG